MLDELQTWWQNAPPQLQVAIEVGSVVVAALLSGHILAVMAGRSLRNLNFDAAFRLPDSTAPGTEAGITPTLVVGILVRLTVWAGAAWWLADRHGRIDLANTLGLIIQRTWALATVLMTALALGSLLARRLIDYLGGLPTAASQSRNGAAAPKGNAAGAVGAAVYVLVMLLALLIAADLFDWPLTRTSALALWQLAQRLLMAGAALLVGCFGARWARDMVPESSAAPEKRTGHYTALAITAATTILAVAVLLSSAGLLVGLAALAVVGILLWLVRGYLPDITAGLQLRAHKVSEVWFDGAPWQVAQVGFLTTQVCRAGQFCRLQNRLVLEARVHGAPAEAGPR